ncbi:MAG: carbohydrate kinase family protein [Desulfobacterales bacterium]|nr:carbohydrate kinase family protein [Desulfobacterales bacterium]
MPFSHPYTLYISGSLAYDRIMDFPGKFSDHILPDKIHILNVCFTVNGMMEKFGGTAGNIAYNLALLEETPLILGSAGKDFDRYEAWLKQNHIPTEAIRIIPEEFTAGAYITTDQSDNQITGFNPGAMKHACEYSVTIAEGQRAIGIISPGCVDDMRGYSRRFKALHIPYICDPGQQIPVLGKDALTEMITGAGILISNDYELEMIQNATGLTQALLREKTGALITTLGEQGSLVWDGAAETRIPAVPAERVLDPTGAGDAYRAGLIKGLVMENPLRKAAEMGATCASYAVACHGTQEHRFDLADFWKRHERQFGKAE